MPTVRSWISPNTSERILEIRIAHSDIVGKVLRDVYEEIAHEMVRRLADDIAVDIRPLLRLPDIAANVQSLLAAEYTKRILGENIARQANDS